MVLNIEIERKEIIQYMYQKLKNESNNTAKCIDFLKYLHEEKKELHYLKDMPGLTIIEEEYINKLLQD